MIPSDYRLENVSARLVERLEGARRSHDAESAREAFRRIAEAHVEAAIGELREVGMLDHPDAHADFLRHEVRETFLPRYTRQALAMNRVEDRGYGFGPLAAPLGRLGLVVAALVSIAVFGRFAPRLPLLWLPVVASLSAPLWPDLARIAHHRRHHHELSSILQDMARIQEQQRAYLRPEELRVDDAPRPQRRKETT